MSNDGSPSLAHMVFFTMKERTDAARKNWSKRVMSI